MIHDYDLADDCFKWNINWDELTYSYSKKGFLNVACTKECLFCLTMSILTSMTVEVK